MNSPLGNWFQDMIKRHGNTGCCKECYVPEKDGDYILPSGHSVVTAYPEGCKDEECECHIMLWRCGKCDQEKLKLGGEVIPEHFRTCPKRT